MTVWMRRRDEHLVEDVRAIQVILAGNLNPQIADLFWKAVLFHATEFPEKYFTRYFSEGRLRLMGISNLPPEAQLLWLNETQANETGAIDVEHDHVWSRSWLQQTLSTDNADLLAVLREYAWGCTLTKGEHGRVGRTNLEGWNKYREAGIRVFDLLIGEWKT